MDVVEPTEPSTDAGPSDPGTPLGTFLRVRRGRVRPQDVGLPGAERRRVPGLRREELAMLAGVSVSYYARLEQGRDTHPSDQVIEALSRVLQLDEDARRHLRALAAPPAPRRRRALRPERARPGIVRLLGRQTTPAVVLGRHMDVLAANGVARAMHVSLQPGRNIVRDAFLDEEARAMYAPGELRRICSNGVASLRAAAGADIDHPRLVELVGELLLESDAFRRMWSRQDIRRKGAGQKIFRHPIVGDVALQYEPLAVAGADGQSLVIYSAEPGSASEQALDLLASLVADGTVQTQPASAEGARAPYAAANQDAG